MNRDELNVEVEHVGLLEALAKAKAGGAPAEVRKASEKLQAFRFKLRTAREAEHPGISVPGVKVKASN